MLGSENLPFFSLKHLKYFLFIYVTTWLKGNMNLEHYQWWNDDLNMVVTCKLTKQLNSHLMKLFLGTAKNTLATSPSISIVQWEFILIRNLQKNMNQSLDSIIRYVFIVKALLCISKIIFATISKENIILIQV